MGKCKHCLAEYDGANCDKCGLPAHHWDYCPRCAPPLPETARRNKWPMAWKEGYQYNRLENLAARRREYLRRAGP